ncbi:MAG: InlB B-repeat-containing protein [Clostridia bacterium]|nr:InlB B-repeat-containing protein [Clostridia bacterium]
MNKLKKSLSVLLTLVMLFTTLCFFAPELGTVEADAAISGIKIVVPETLYLTPSSGSQTAIQYYINNNADGSVSASQDTSAKVHITYPGAKLTSISAKTSAAITLPDSITGLVGTTFGSSATTATGTFSLPAGLNAGGTALVEWTFVFDVNGNTQTHYAYSVAYAPWYQPVGAASKAVGSNANVYSSSILWVQGVHGYSDGDRANSWYVQTANFLPMLGTIKAPENNNPETNWIQSGSNGLSPTMAYNVITESGTKYHARANTISPTANLTVDISRYNNFNQIPNLKVGFMITDHENAAEGSWYVSDYGTNNGSSYYNGTDRSGSRYDDDYNDTGTIISGWSNSADYSCGIKVNQQSWNKGVTGTASFRLKAGVYAYKKSGLIKSTSWNNNFVNISVTGANKGTLRTNVLNGTTYAKENYTADTWNTYYAALKNAATNLGNPTSATVDTSALTTAEAGLHTNLTLDANGGALGAGVPSPVAMNVGAGTSVSFNNADVKDAFYATRTGYTFLGWSTDKDATSAPATVTVGFNDTVYAVWQANKYQVVFDNLIDYPAWNKAAGNGTVSDITDNGFTITSNDGAGESTSESPYFPVTPGKKYKVHMDITGTAWDVYIFFCDADGNWIDFADGPSNRYSTGGSTGVDPENAIFTAPDKAEVVKAKIRVDANGSNNTVRFENIRVFEVDNENADISYEAPIMVTYDQPFGTLPTPTRTGYEFQGWVDENGTPYASSTKVAITETLRLYSTWELGTYTITFDTKGGNAINSISGHYGDAVTKPADPTKPGYLFTGWDKTVPDTIPPENTTITATWSENSYAVFFDGNGQTGGTTPDQINTTYTGEFTIPECTYEKNGYTFTYWTTNKDGTGTKYYAGDKVSKLTTVRDGGVTLYAQWSVNSYNITYIYDNGTGETKVIPFDINATVNALAAPEKVGHTFAGWLVTSAEGNWALGTVVAEGVTATGMYGNVTFTAQWTANEYTITFDTDGGTPVAPITQDFGTPVTAPAAPTKVGYTFAGWADLPATMPAGNVTVKATWTVNEYTVSYNANGGEGTVEAQTFKYTDSVTLRDNAFTKTGYHFIGWAETPDGEVKYAGGASVDAAFTADDGATITLYAVWEANTYTVKFNNNDAAATGTMDDMTFTYDAEAKALAENKYNKTGYHFLGWSEDSTATTATYADMEEVRNLTAEENGVVTLYAVWEINTYEVIFNYKNVDGTDVTLNLPAVEHGTEFASICPKDVVNVYYLSSDRVNHFEFVAWDKDEAAITSDIVYTATYTAVAHSMWEDVEHSVPAKCDVPGVYAEGCDCGFRYQEETAALEHKYVDVAGTNTATCTEDGTITKKCSECQKTIVTESKAFGHTEKEAVQENIKAAECTVDGSYDLVVYCETCNSVVSKETVTVDATGHVFGDTIAAVAPGCTTEGNSAYKPCTVCNKFFAADADNFSEEAHNSEADFVIGANGHDTVEVPAVNPDCENDGNYKYYTCNNCELLFSDEEGTVIITIEDTVDAKLGHAYGELIAEDEATCEETGTKAHYKCSRCDKLFDEEKNEVTADDLVIEAKGHDYGTLVPEVEATCVKEGVKAHYTCSVCGKHFDENKAVLESLVIAKNDNHSLETVEAKAPTCENYGWDEYQYCIREGCTYTEYVELPKLGHDYVGEITTDPTCTEKGEKTFTCKNDSTHTYKEAVDALGHTFNDEDKVAYVAPQCTTDGNEAYKKCAVCELYFEDAAEVNATNGVESADAFVLTQTGHNYVAVITYPTCTTGGYTTHTCDACGDTYKDATVDALGHESGEPVVEEDNPASCLVDGSYQEVVYCKVCNEELSRVDKVHVAPGHNEAVRQENIKNATCTVAGSYDNVTYCTVCGVVINTETVSGVTLPHTYEEKIVDAAHLKQAATCYSLAVYYYDCKDCDATGNADYTFTYGTTLEHTPADEAVTEDFVDSTCYQEGSYNEVVYCSVAECHEKLSSTPKTVEKKSHTPAAAVEEDLVDSTCYEEGSYNEVVYCSVAECHEKLSSTPKTVEKKAHTPGAAVEEDRVEATCYAEGSYNEVVYCSVAECHEKLSSTPKTIAKVAHTAGTAVQENRKESTCYEAGSYEEVVYCSVCEEANVADVYEFSRVTKAIAKKDHTRATEAVEENIVAPTCYKEGTYDEVFYCSVCKEANVEDAYEFSREEKTIAKIAHTPAPAVEEDRVEPSCHTEGSCNEVVYCSVKECGEKLSSTPKTIAKVAHTPGAVVVENEKAPTCYQEGSYDNVTYCSVCEAAGKGKEETSRETIPVPMVAHTPAEAVKENIVAPKCEENGSHDEVVYCSVCAAAGKEFEISRETVTDAMTGHISGTYTENIDEDAGNCMTDATWIEVTYCNACDKELSRANKTGEGDSTIHTGNNTVKKEDVVPGTCTSEETWNDVTYCECGAKVNTEAKTGEKDAANHSGTPTKLVNEKAPTCKDEGYTGDTLYSCCDELYAKGTAIPTTDHTPDEAVIENEVKVTCTADGSYDEVVYCAVCDTLISSTHYTVASKGHTPGSVVYENETPATETTNGQRDEVVYCTVCNAEISRTTVVTKVERTITFVMYDKTVSVKAYTGDAVTSPIVSAYTTEDGFIHVFKDWDRPVETVTGDTTYTAVYTQPCDYSEIDALEKVLGEILDGGLADEEELEANKDEIEKVLAQIEEIKKDKNTRDESEQNEINAVVDRIEILIDTIYPDAGSTLTIVGASTFYTGTILDLKAVKISAGSVQTVVNDAVWTSSDENIVFFSNGKLYAIGTGTVTLTATRGILKASKTITVVTGGNTRGINFTSIDKTHFIIEDYMAVYNSAIIYWSDDYELHFRVRVYQNFMFEDYIVYVNGVEVEPDENGYYTIPAGSGDARVTIAGAIVDIGEGEGEVVTKWSFWEWLLNLFRKIVAFFTGGKA